MRLWLRLYTSSTKFVHAVLVETTSFWEDQSFICRYDCRDLIHKEPMAKTRRGGGRARNVENPEVGGNLSATLRDMATVMQGMMDRMDRQLENHKGTTNTSVANPDRVDGGKCGPVALREAQLLCALVMQLDRLCNTINSRRAICYDCLYLVRQGWPNSIASHCPRAHRMPNEKKYWPELKI
ncbi:hypothetical protein VNO77_34514 [Canavalia gladiata]|uniref:Uncharacterized protein n=1 Tax=Canavalia gladiata TaxID=3824 RepID=A0AAN9PZA9_CANGL